LIEDPFAAEQVTAVGDKIKFGTMLKGSMETIAPVSTRKYEVAPKMKALT